MTSPLSSRLDTLAHQLNAKTTGGCCISFAPDKPFDFMAPAFSLADFMVTSIFAINGVCGHDTITVILNNDAHTNAVVIRKSIEPISRLLLDAPVDQAEFPQPMPCHLADQAIVKILVHTLKKLKLHFTEPQVTPLDETTKRYTFSVAYRCISFEDAQAIQRAAPAWVESISVFKGRLSITFATFFAILPVL